MSLPFWLGPVYDASTMAAAGDCADECGDGEVAMMATRRAVVVMPVDGVTRTAIWQMANQ